MSHWGFMFAADFTVWTIFTVAVSCRNARMVLALHKPAEIARFSCISGL